VHSPEPAGDAETLLAGFCWKSGAEEATAVMLEERWGGCTHTRVMEALCAGIQIEPAVSDVPLDLVRHYIADRRAFPDTVPYPGGGNFN
jgi:hypothetical protein